MRGKSGWLMGDRGSLTVEAALALPFFLFALILYLSVVKAACVQMALDCAVRETAREIASVSYPLSLYNEWEEEHEQSPAGQEENILPAWTGQMIGKLLNGEANESGLDMLDAFIREVAEVANDELPGAFAAGMDSAGRYAAEKILQKNADLRGLDPARLTLRLVELPKSKRAFKEKVGSTLYMECGLVPGEDFGPDDIVVQADYLLEIPLPWFTQAALTVRQTAIERAWLIGSNGVVTSHREQGLFDHEAGEETAIVYVTRTGQKYHSGGCRYLRKSRIPMTLKEAKARYEPCKVCRPPH